MEVNRKLGKNVNCSNCGKEFYINPSRFKNKIHNCSTKCMGESNSKRFSKKIKVNCQVCSKEIFYRKSAFKQIKYHTCSRQCRSVLIKTVYKGNNNPRALKLSEEDRYFRDRCSDYNQRAAIKKIPFDLTPEFLKNLFKKQQGLCYYSGLSMELKSNKNRKISAASFNVASLDRIDSNKGYTQDNVVWCLNCINMLKAHHDMSDIKKVMQAIMQKEKKQTPLKVKKLYVDSTLPVNTGEGNAGYDLTVHHIEEYENYFKVYSGIAIEPDHNYFFYLAPRSSTYKKGLTLYNNLGIIDNSYRGEIIGIFQKTKDYKDGNLKIGDRIMQIVPQEFVVAKLIEVNELTDTERSDKGFGSTGV